VPPTIATVAQATVPRARHSTAHSRMRHGNTNTAGRFDERDDDGASASSDYGGSTVDKEEDRS
jgi:hypothetical protein